MKWWEITLMVLSIVGGCTVIFVTTTILVINYFERKIDKD